MRTLFSMAIRYDFHDYLFGIKTTGKFFVCDVFQLLIVWKFQSISIDIRSFFPPIILLVFLHFDLHSINRSSITRMLCTHKIVWFNSANTDLAICWLDGERFDRFAVWYVLFEINLIEISFVWIALRFSFPRFIIILVFVVVLRFYLPASVQNN